MGIRDAAAAQPRLSRLRAGKERRSRSRPKGETKGRQGTGKSALSYPWPRKRVHTSGCYDYFERHGTVPRTQNGVSFPASIAESSSPPSPSSSLSSSSSPRPWSARVSSRDLLILGLIFFSSSIESGERPFRKPPISAYLRLTQVRADDSTRHIGTRHRLVQQLTARFEHGHCYLVLVLGRRSSRSRPLLEHARPTTSTLPSPRTRPTLLTQPAAAGTRPTHDLHHQPPVTVNRPLRRSIRFAPPPPPTARQHTRPPPWARWTPS